MEENMHHTPVVSRHRESSATVGFSSPHHGETSAAADASTPPSPRGSQILYDSLVGPSTPEQGTNQPPQNDSPLQLVVSDLLPAPRHKPKASVAAAPLFAPLRHTAVRASADPEAATTSKMAKPAARMASEPPKASKQPKISPEHESGGGEGEEEHDEDNEEGEDQAEASSSGSGDSEDVDEGPSEAEKLEDLKKTTAWELIEEYQRKYYPQGLPSHIDYNEVWRYLYRTPEKVKSPGKHAFWASFRGLVARKKDSSLGWRTNQPTWRDAIGSNGKLQSWCRPAAVMAIQILNTGNQTPRFLQDQLEALGLLWFLEDPSSWQPGVFWEGARFDAEWVAANVATTSPSWRFFKRTSVDINPFFRSDFLRPNASAMAGASTSIAAPVPPPRLESAVAVSSTAKVSNTQRATSVASSTGQLDRVRLFVARASTSVAAPVPPPRLESAVDVSSTAKVSNTQRATSVDSSTGQLDPVRLFIAGASTSVASPIPPQRLESVPPATPQEAPAPTQQLVESGPSNRQSSLSIRDRTEGDVAATSVAGTDTDNESMLDIKPTIPDLSRDTPTPSVMTTSQNDLEEVRKSVEDLAKASSKNKRRISEAFGKIESRFKTVNGQVSDIDKRLKTGEDQWEKAGQSIEDIQKRLQSLEEDPAGDGAPIQKTNSLKLRMANDKLASAVAQNETLTSTLQATNALNVTYSSSLEAANARILALSSDLTAAHSQNATLTANLGLMPDRIADLTARLETATKASAAKEDTIAALQEQLAEAKSEIRALQAKCASVQEDRDVFRAKYGAYALQEFGLGELKEAIAKRGGESAGGPAAPLGYKQFSPAALHNNACVSRKE